MGIIRQVVMTVVALALSACAATREMPAARSDAGMRSWPDAHSFFVVAANPLATEAGLAVLRRGGSAVDAAIAVQAMLSLVEPQSSGVGGGAFMTYFDAAAGKVVVYDGRETAPAGASPDMFLGVDGEPLPFNQAVLSGRATGVPGVVAMLKMAHDAHGALPWSSLFGDAEKTAVEGFTISPRLGRFLTMNFTELSAPDVRHYFAAPDGGFKKTGDRLRNPVYGAFLQRLAKQGPSALYAGETARRIVERVRAGPIGGSMTMTDLAGYRPQKREALCGPYRLYLVCVPPPPSSGVGFLQLLALLDHTDIAARGPGDPQAWFLFAQASRIMYADRDRFVGDAAFANVPIRGLLDPAYVAQRARLIGDKAGPAPAAGAPPGAPQAAIDTTREPAGTSHFIIGDAQGDVVSMTTTVESIFGTGRMVDGFFLNNQMTDFARDPRDDQGRLSANAVAPGKRPRSSMIPLIMLDSEGRFAGALGSAGGNSILAYVAKSLVGAVDWGLPMQDAIALPNLVARGNDFGGEVDKFSLAVIDGLQRRGITLSPGQGEDSGIQGVMIRHGQFDGGYDPRREGRAIIESSPRNASGNRH